MNVVTREDLAGYAGTWEALQHQALLDIYARNFGCRVLERGGFHVAGRRVPGLGLLRAQLYSPEAVETDWIDAASGLPAGRVEVMTNVQVPAKVATALSPPDLYSFVVDLRPGADAAFAALRPNARHAVREAQREGMKVFQRDEDGLPAFHEVLWRVTRGGTVYGAPDLALLRAIMRAGFGRLYVLEYRSRVVGGQFVLVNRHAQAFLLAFDREGCDGLSANLLYWTVMQAEIEAGMPFLDLGAQSISRHPGLTSAKRSLGCLLLPAYQYQFTPARWRARLGDALRGLTRDDWLSRPGRAGVSAGS